MFNNLPILSLITFLPLLGAIALMFFARMSKGEANGSAMALTTIWALTEFLFCLCF